MAVNIMLCFNVIFRISTFCVCAFQHYHFDHCYKTRAKPRSWQVGFLDSPFTTQTALSSVKFCYSFSEIYSRPALQSNTLLQSDHVFYAYKNCLYFMKKTLMIWFLRLFHIFIADDSYTLVTMQMLYTEVQCWCL
jgi:hypothetical protein